MKWMNRFDAALLACALIISAGMFAMRVLTPQSAAITAEIRVDGQTVARLPLAREREYTAQSGDDYVRVAVKDGAARVYASSCRDQLCVKKGRISSSGQSVVCLPNKVTVLITGEGDVPDAILY